MLLIPLGDTDKLLNEQCHSLDDTMASMLTATFPANTLMKLATIAEASLVLFSIGSLSLLHQYQQCIRYIKEMLRKQLIAPIGKEVHQKDFQQQFMEFHCQKIFAPQFAPKPFSYTIRCPNHYPDGMLSIEGLSALMPGSLLARMHHLFIYSNQCRNNRLVLHTLRLFL